jgi:hypothetical protein
VILPARKETRAEIWIVLKESSFIRRINNE